MDTTTPLRLLQRPLRAHALPAWPAARLLALHTLLVALFLYFVAISHRKSPCTLGNEGSRG
jgi:hypothetical protein